jgi:outer membrane protein assembly factor BamE
MNRVSIIAFLACAVILLGGCLGPYRQDIQQGNLLTNEDLSQLRKGMTQREVAYILGTPLVADPFHQDRWDYFYSYKNGRTKETESKRLTVVFEDLKLSSLEGYIDIEGVQALEPSEEDTHHGGTVITESTQKGGGIFERAADAFKD